MPAQDLSIMTLTRSVNKMKPPQAFLRTLLFRNVQVIDTEEIELSFNTRGRQVAPFVRAGAEGKLVGGWDESFRSIQAPNVRIKRALNPSKVAFVRRPGMRVFNTASEHLNARQRHIATNLKILNDDAMNTIEWMCGASLTGTITYEDADGEVFDITIPRPSSHTITLSTFWDDATPSDVTVQADTELAHFVLSEFGVVPNIALCGREAANALRAQINGGFIKSLDLRRTDAAQINMDATFNAQGAKFIGRIGGTDFWEYSRQVTLWDNTQGDLIRSKYVEFLSTIAPFPDAPVDTSRVLYYAAIPDADAGQDMLFVGQKFAKSWNEKDPSARMLLLHTRPLPVPRDGDSWVSMKVVSG